MRSFFAAQMLVAALLLAACQTNDLKEPPIPLGNFALGVNVAITDKMQVPSISRKVTPAQMENAVTRAVEARFGADR